MTVGIGCPTSVSIAGLGHTSRASRIASVAIAGAPNVRIGVFLTTIRGRRERTSVARRKKMSKTPLPAGYNDSTCYYRSDDACDNCGGPIGKRGTAKYCPTCYRRKRNEARRTPGGEEYERLVRDG